MFSGIVQEIGSVVSREKIGAVIAIEIKTHLRPTVGSSVMINGICATMVEKKKNILRFEFVSETQRKTTVATWTVGTKLNLEPSLRLGDEVAGHLVSGHVDAVGTIAAVRKNKNEALLTVVLDQSLKKFIVPKGSVCIDGVSLTIVTVHGGRFTVALIPHTLRVTTLHQLRKNSRVNIEIDTIARYVINFLQKHATKK